MEDRVTLQQLADIRGKMQEIIDQYQHIGNLRGRLWKDLPQLPAYNPSSALRDLPPPWTGHGFAVFLAIWLMLLDLWGGGLLGGLLFGLCTWVRIKSQKSMTRWLCLFFIIVTAPVIAMVALTKLMNGGSWSMVLILGFAAWFLGGLLMVPAKMKANIAIKAENEARTKKNAEMAPYNRKLRAEISDAEGVATDLHDQLADLIQYYDYPPNYATVHAVDYFIRCVRNRQADTYGALIGLYEEELHRQRMIEESRRQTQLLREQAENQERIQDQLAYANMLQFQQFLAQKEANEHLAHISGDRQRPWYTY